MKYYELAYIVVPELSDEELNAFCQKVNNFIAEEAGILDIAEKPIRKALGYPINKKTEAFLVSFTFRIIGEKLANIEKKIKEEKNILRYMIITKKDPGKSAKKTSRGARVLKYKTEIKIDKQTTKEKTDKEKVELKEIDKKIEEILQEV
jgi:small subunit ribosomal protein S6